MEFDDGSVVRAHLDSDETLLWSGRPAGGVRLQPSDAVTIPFSLMWGGFAVFWEYSVIHSGGAPLFFVLWGVPFVLVGIYLIVGRFFWDAYQRDKTHYAVTNRRVIFIREGMGGKTTSLPLRAVPAIEVSGGRGRGTVTFGNGGMTWFNSSSWPGTKHVPPSFVAIENAPGVAEIVRRAIREAA